MTCAACGVSADPALQLGAIAVCSACGASNVVATATRATLHDLQALTAPDLAKLQRARAAIARPERKQR